MANRPTYGTVSVFVDGGFLTNEDRRHILDCTDCAASLNQRGLLTVVGPVDRVTEALALAQDFVADRAREQAPKRRRTTPGGAWQAGSPASSQQGWNAGSQQGWDAAHWQAWYVDPQQGFPASSQQRWNAAHWQGCNAAAHWQDFPASSQQGWNAGSQQGWDAAHWQGWYVDPQQGLPAGSQQGLPAGSQQGLPADPWRGKGKNKRPCPGLPGYGGPDPGTVWEKVLDACFNALLQTDLHNTVSMTKFVWHDYDRLPRRNTVPNDTPPFHYPGGQALQFARIDMHRGTNNDDRGNVDHKKMFHLRSIKEWYGSQAYLGSNPCGKGNVVEGLIGTCYAYATNHYFMQNSMGPREGWVEIQPDRLISTAVLTWFALQRVGFGPTWTTPGWARRHLDWMYEQQLAIMARETRG